jgi:cobalt/nickel transport system permease protein
MHIPDGFLNTATSIGTGVVAAGGVGAALRQTGKAVAADKRIPLAGITAAVIFVLQMVNFPVALGTSGHLLGGALAAILLGPWMGVLVVTVVVAVQALIFADGGVSALGPNIFNMAIITALVGWATFRLVRSVTPNARWSVLTATFLAGLVSVVASSLGFVIQYAIGGQGGAPLGSVLTAMASVHVLIGIGEGIISAAIVGALLSTRPDLVAGAADLRGGSVGSSRATVVVGAVLAVVLAFGVAPFANPNPDGLERVAIDLGFEETAAEEHAIGGPLADYVVEGLGENPISVGIAGVVGALIVAGVAWLIARAVRRREPIA